MRDRGSNRSVRATGRSRQAQHRPGRHAAMRLLGANPDIDAIVAFNDTMAMGAMVGCQDLGFRVPEGVAVVGYDGIPYGEVTVPPLTTMAQDSFGMAQAGVEGLADFHGVGRPGRRQHASVAAAASDSRLNLTSLRPGSQQWRNVTVHMDSVGGAACRRSGAAEPGDIRLAVPVVRDGRFARARVRTQ